MSRVPFSFWCLFCGDGAFRNLVGVDFDVLRFLDSEDMY